MFTGSGIKGPKIERVRYPSLEGASKIRKRGLLQGRQDRPG